jgi:hypothetical protein
MRFKHSFGSARGSLLHPVTGSAEGAPMAEWMRMREMMARRDVRNNIVLCV